MPLDDDRLFSLRDESRRRVVLGFEPSRYSDLSAHGRQAISVAADPRHDPPAVDAEHRVITESQHFDPVGGQPGQLAGSAQDVLCRCGLERGSFVVTPSDLPVPQAERV
ncbi:hypothetical protein [Streptomyces sp. TRM72054]|uniref:hypothetical protein n=1 Tax=Streptomyces sp. TRM72054 TaxID=2870562 RepID=UPI0021AB87EA|nr:hypothetical protein [Streptomyces sp. TRM72054]